MPPVVFSDDVSDLVAKRVERRNLYPDATMKLDIVRHSATNLFNRLERFRFNPALWEINVMPAKAGIQLILLQIPASAGMTDLGILCMAKSKML